MEDDEAELAERAVRQFLGRSASLARLGRGESVTYRVEAGPDTYLLRVHESLHAPFDPTLLSPDAIASECAWLEALARDTSLGAPDPVQAPGGAFVLEARGVPCTLLRWVDGDAIEGQPTAEQAGRLGALLAALQIHAEGWVPPPDFVRPTHDRRWTHEAVRRLELLASRGVVAAEDVERITRAVGVVEEELTPLAQDPELSGLIHADLHDENYVFHGDEARPIDFGRCGFGPWLYDVAECAMHLVPDRRRDLIDTYAAARPFGDGDLRRVEGYLIAAVTETYGHHAPNPDEHAALARNLSAVADRHVRRYLEGQPFLFEL